LIDIKIVDKYLEDLGNPDPKYWPAARYELVKLGTDVTEFLIKFLKHKNPVMRGRVARILGEIGDKETVPFLIDLLKTDKDSYVCSSAASALGEINDSRSLDILIEKLSVKEPKVRKESAMALGKLQDTIALEPLMKYYEKSSGEEKIWAIYALIKLGKSELVHLLEDNLKEDVLLAAITVAGHLNLTETVPLLLELLGISKDVKFRIEIIKSLAQTGNPLVREKLEYYYGQCRGEERIWVIYALCKLGDRDKAGVILDVLERDVRKASAMALGETGNKDSCGVLLKALVSDEGELRYRAVQALQKLGDIKILEHLEHALSVESETYIKLAIEEAIGSFKKGEV
jgi:HEAT repeat protein